MEMPWFWVGFDRNEVADGTPERFLVALRHCFVAGGWPPEAATFVELEVAHHSTSTVCRVVHYISPRGADLARSVLARFAAEECRAPSPECVTLCLWRGAPHRARRLLLQSI